MTAGNPTIADLPVLIRLFVVLADACTSAVEVTGSIISQSTGVHDGLSVGAQALSSFRSVTTTFDPTQWAIAAHRRVM